MKHLEGSGMPVPYIGRKFLKGQGKFQRYLEMTAISKNYIAEESKTNN